MRIFAALNLNLLHQIELGSVVQLDRISDSGSEGWGFESLRGHKKIKEAVLPPLSFSIAGGLLSFTACKPTCKNVVFILAKR